MKHFDINGKEIKIGDTVKVVCALPHGIYRLHNFNNSWNCRMDEAVNSCFEVGRIGADGVSPVDSDDVNWYYFPCFCLAVVDPEIDEVNKFINDIKNTTLKNALKSVMDKYNIE